MITIFSQFGEPVFVKLVRDKETGKSKGFGWLKYEDQRSCDLAVDNLGGAEISGRLVRVDHARYKARDDEDQDEFRVGWEDLQRKEGKNLSEDEISDAEEAQRPMLEEEKDLAKLIHDHDDDDPMKAFLIEEKKKEVEEAKKKAGKKEHRHKHRSHRSHRSRHDVAREDKKLHRNGSPTESSRHRRRDRSRDGERDRHSSRRHEDENRDRERQRQRGRVRDKDDERHRNTEREGDRSRRRRDRDGDDERRQRRRSRSRSPRRHERHER